MVQGDSVPPTRLDKVLSSIYPKVLVSALAVFLAFFIFGKLSNKHGRSQVERFESSLVKAEANRAAVAKALVVNLDRLEAERIKGYLGQVQSMEKYHRSIAGYFWPRYYMAMNVAAVASVLAGVLIILISAGGWANSHWLLRTVFLCASAVAAIYGLLPQVFNQSANINQNQRLYFSHVDLENEIISWMLARQKGVSQNNVTENAEGDRQAGEDPNKELVRFMEEVDKRLEELSSFAIGFDESKLRGARDLAEGMQVE